MELVDDLRQDIWSLIRDCQQCKEEEPDIKCDVGCFIDTYDEVVEIVRRIEEGFYNASSNRRA